MLFETPPSTRHSLVEDAQGILVGATLVALSVQFLRASDLVTGQLAGLSLIIAIPTGWTFGWIFFLINLPFYALALRKFGKRFTVKTLIAVTVMSAMTEMIPHAMTINDLHPALGAAFAGILAGVGLILLFRHGATLGGVGIVAVWLQNTRDIKAGNVQLAFDLFVFSMALLVLPLASVAWSLLGAVVLNVIITVNHRHDRYVARS